MMIHMTKIGLQKPPQAVSHALYIIFRPTVYDLLEVKLNTTINNRNIRLHGRKLVRGRQRGESICYMLKHLIQLGKMRQPK